MNIAIDARLLSGRMTGISRYLLNVLKYIPRFDKVNKYFLYIHNDVDFNDDFFNYIYVQKKKIPAQLYSHYWLNFVLPNSLARNNIDVFYTPYILVPLKRGTYKNVIVIHDSMPTTLKEYYTFHYRKYMEKILPPAIKRSDAIVTVSESARKDLIKYQNIPEGKIHAIHLWTDENYIPRSLDKERIHEFRSKYSLPEKYVLYVGAIEKRKNIEGILKVSDLVADQGEIIKFVLVGSNGYGHEEIVPEIEKRKDRVIRLSYVEEVDLPLIYNLAYSFIFPSHYEGFGLPPLEAMKSGIPVLASNNSSLSEVVGNGGILLADNDYEAYAKNIVKIYNDRDFYNKMKKQGLEQAKIFTPEVQMPKLINVFNRFK